MQKKGNPCFQLFLAAKYQKSRKKESWIIERKRRKDDFFSGFYKEKERILIEKS